MPSEIRGTLVSQGPSERLNAPESMVALVMQRGGGMSALWRGQMAGAIRRLAALFLLSLMAAGPARAGALDASLVIDANTGRVLHDSEGDELRHPASLTKMMTLYIVFGEIEAGRMSCGTRIKVSERAAEQAPSKLKLDPGEDISAIDAIKALITKSANDVAVALAEHVAGSEAAFAKLMTERARRIGMTKTVFRNASGLPDPEQVTTARDMITLGLRLYDDFPKQWPLFSTRAFSYQGNSYRNHNTLLGTYEGVDGIKTGYTRMSGFNIVTSAQRGGKHLMVAVFGGDTAAERNATARNLLNRAWLQASSQKTRRVAPALIASAKPVARPAPRPVAEPSPAIRPAVAAKPAPAPSAARAAAQPAQRPIAETAPPPVVVPDAPAQAPSEEQVAAGGSRPDAQDKLMMDQLVAAAAAPPVEIARVSRVAFAGSPAAMPVTDAGARDLIGPPPDSVAAEQTIGDGAVAGRAGTFASNRIIIPADGPGLGRLPSTLDAQAKELSTDEPPLPATPAAFVAVESARRPMQVAALPAAAPPVADAAPAASAGPFQIQVGAFGSQGEAERALSAVRARTGDLLKPYGEAAIAVQKDNRKLFRARFVGIEGQSAQGVCAELRKMKLDCFVMKAE